MGIKYLLDGANFTDPAMPIIRDDPVLADGTLLLVDLGHSLGRIAAGLPAEGSAIPNIAYRQAATLIGSGDQASLSPTWSTSGLTSGDAIVERSGKLGLHVIMSQVNDEEGDNARVAFPAAIKQYMLDHPTHDYALSVWERLTRPAVAGATADIEAGIYNSFIGPATSNNLMLFSRFQGYPGVRLGARGMSVQAAGNVLRNMAVDGFTGTLPASLSQIEAVWTCGGYGAFATYMTHKSRSAIFYRMVFEDLTASGRTYADFDAADLAAFNAAFAAGGRFYGDTFTDPATLP